VVNYGIYEGCVLSVSRESAEKHDETLVTVAGATRLSHSPLQLFADTVRNSFNCRCHEFGIIGLQNGLKRCDSTHNALKARNIF